MSVRSCWGALSVCVFLFGLVGCAAPVASVEQMMVGGEPTHRVDQTLLRGNVAVNEVTARQADSRYIAPVGSSEFAQAIEGSLRTFELLPLNRQTGRFALTAHLQNLEPIVRSGFMNSDITVTASVNYVVVERATGKAIFRRTIAVPYTVKLSGPLSVTERMKLAYEGAVRTNISQMIDELFKLKIEGIAASMPPSKTSAYQTSEEQLRELKRLNDADLITKDVYLERQKVILENSN